MSMPSSASPQLSLTPPRRSALAHIPGNEGWPIVGNTLQGACRSQGPRRTQCRSLRPGLSQPHVRRDQRRPARARGQRTRAVRSGQAVLLHPWLGPVPRASVPARPDAARFRRTPAAPPRAVGRLQGRADEVLPGAARQGHRASGSRSGRRGPGRCCSIPRSSSSRSISPPPRSSAPISAPRSTRSRAPSSTWWRPRSR